MGRAIVTHIWSPETDQMSMERECKVNIFFWGGRPWGKREELIKDACSLAPDARTEARASDILRSVHRRHLLGSVDWQHFFHDVMLTLICFDCFVTWEPIRLHAQTLRPYANCSKTPMHLDHGTRFRQHDCLSYSATSRMHHSYPYTVIYISCSLNPRKIISCFMMLHMHA